MAGVARIGCSGWHYKGWVGPFYGADVPPDRWLEVYASRFDTVELNNTFYRLPEASQFTKWRAAVPADFTFAVKASRYLTHLKRLRDPQEPLNRLLERVKALGTNLGPLLFQLPPRWVPDQQRLLTFLDALPLRVRSARHVIPLRHVIEFRDARGYSPEMLADLEQHRVSVCIHDMPDSASPRIATGSLVYVRFHGYGAKYGGSYPQPVLIDWARWLAGPLDAGLDVFAYFNNDVDGHAIDNASRFRELLSAWVPTRRDDVGRAMPAR